MTQISLPERAVVPFREGTQTGEGTGVGGHQEPDFGNLDGNWKL